MDSKDDNKENNTQNNHDLDIEFDNPYQDMPEMNEEIDLNKVNIENKPEPTRGK